MARIRRIGTDIFSTMLAIKLDLHGDWIKLMAEKKAWKNFTPEQENAWMGLLVAIDEIEKVFDDTERNEHIAKTVDAIILEIAAESYDRRVGQKKDFDRSAT